MDDYDPAELRRPYAGAPLHRSELHAHPMQQFRRWFTEALDAGMSEPNAMVLATADAQGVPRGRTVLMKGYDEAGLWFFTNRTSRKGADLAVNPNASVVFPWHRMRRQVIVTGRVECLSEEENDTYFAQRPYGSQLGAWASEHQSSPLASREELDKRFEAYLQRWPEGQAEVPRPRYWGGYRLLPFEVEFWQGRADRLHDRFRYVPLQDPGGWRVERLAP
ncbi:pyridoxamine 5'-phosphate oxidase [Lipingzhangella sp. LS1_29]|uniref:Pyridoxine/pyridoxamine 5'-phosphate oxidase n=1 Tax=Lipingzhangella rawalii TaxID=2055835 RepID=A0ABU2H4E5_9ACTN|nr:pyridoxamine 5'-phosphate oxidase [Lipingzhangella rawalii]MDS1270172.1 pyridoxamine 5'-phosphate oxidase [Lipingzhangella rawalii]